ncbi:MAG TPA: hypothetical protein VM286_00045 [Candidatus Thermoplasmatota archaeon]|nr:hypothetical protein [Candidatus Thermoplasmatota archaeon]
MAARLPLLFEALPPSATASPAHQEAHLQGLEGLRSRRLAAVNVPEVLDGHYRTVPTLPFAAELQRRLGVPAIVNRVTVHHGLPALRAWAEDAWLDFGIRDLVLVGGERGGLAYPGAHVEPSLADLRAGCSLRGGSLGVVTIPTRRRPVLDEPERLLRKRQAGASFAVSQILAEAEAAVRLHRDASAALGTRDFTIYWSLAPVARRRDVEFLEWLGVQVPPAVRKGLLESADPAAVLARSHRLNGSLARTILEATEGHGLRSAFCIEHVMQSNVGAAIDLVDRIADLAREFSLRAPAPLLA